MEDNGYRFGVGVLVLAATVIGSLLVVFFGAVPNFWQSRYTVVYNFPAAPGVAVDTPILKNGVQVGRVVRIVLLPNDRGVNLIMELDSQYQLRQSEIARISSGSIITGDAVIEFLPPTRESLLARFDGIVDGVPDGQLQQQELDIAESPIEPDQYLTGGEVAGDPLDVLVRMQANFSSTLVAIEGASRKVEGLAETLQTVLGGSQTDIEELLQQIRFTVGNFNETLDSIEQVFDQMQRSGLPEALAEAVGKMPDVIDYAQDVLKQTQGTLASFERVGNTAEGVLQNVEAFTQPISGRGEEFFNEIMMTVRNLDAAIRDINQFTERLGQGEGTIARLLDDPQLYWSAVQSLENIERLTHRLEPILNDVRVFTDKVARDPGGQVGIRGALNRTPTGAGFK